MDQSISLVFNKAKYYSKGFIFKLLSMSDITVFFYRQLANFLAPVLKRNLDISTWKHRGDLLIHLIEKYDCLKKDDKVFETGTGWFHFYSIYIRIFHKVSVTMFDIWDNRQWSVFKSNFKRLEFFDYDTEKRKSTTTFLNVLKDCSNYEELYKKLDLAYIINKQGSIADLESNSFDLIVSFHVLEHIPEDSFNSVVNDFYRILKPGGFCIHQIGCDDHLAHGTTLNPKNYIKYSDKTWSRFFKNKVQYTNRLQMSDYLRTFNNSGFRLIEKIPTYTDISNVKTSESFLHYPKEDLQCGKLTVVYRK